MRIMLRRLTLSLTLKLVALCLLLVLVPVLIIGSMALFQIAAFGDQTVSESAAVLEKQALDLLEAGVERDARMVQALVDRARDDVLRLSGSSNVANYFKAVSGQNQVLNNLAQREVVGIVESFLSACKIQRDVMEQKVKSDLLVAHNTLMSRGGADLKGLSVEWNAVNQLTNEGASITLPLMQVGFDPLNPATSSQSSVPIVDEVRKLVGATCTIFQRMNEQGDMLRVATNVKNQDGTRAAGTFIPAVNPDGTPNSVISAVLQGNTFTGRAQIMGVRHTTAYRPIYPGRATGGDIIGMLHAGADELGSGELSRAINQTAIGKSGYLAVADSSGKILVHRNENLIGKNLVADLGLTAFKNVFQSRQVGKAKTVAFDNGDSKQFIIHTYFPDWDWIIFGVGNWEEFSTEASQVSMQLLDGEIKSFHEAAVLNLTGKAEPLYDEIIFADEKGRGIISLTGGRISTATGSHAGEPWFQDALPLKPGEMSSTGVLVSPEDQRPYVLLSAPVFLESGLKGVIAFRMNWDLAWNSIKNSTYGVSGYPYILDENGVVVAHPKIHARDRINVGDAQYGQLASLVGNKLLKGEKGHGRYIFEGIKKFIAFRPLQVGQKHFCVAACGPAEEFLALADSIKTQSDARAKRILKILGISIFGLILAGGLTGLFATRGISRPLEDSIRELSGGSLQLRQASIEVSSVSQQVADRASEQAAAVEEISSTLQELASMTRLNASNADAAMQSRRTASKAITAANEAMAQSIEAMDRIRASGEETAKIIKAIEGIAFKTNLLSLNAAVEAARAGEAGLGFGVVAGEVGNLAKQAADAAKATELLIEQMAANIQAGSKLLNSTKDAFRVNLNEDRKMSEFMDQIAAASVEQAEGVEQIAKALAEFDTTIQQNAVNAEQSASAAEEMSAQAMQLQEIVARLKTLISGRNGDLYPADGLKNGSSLLLPGKAFQSVKIQPAKRIAGRANGNGQAASNIPEDVADVSSHNQSSAGRFEQSH